jgi:hypothetical protein
MKIENIRIFNHNEEIHGFLKSELLKLFSEIGYYKVYDKIDQYKYLCIRIIFHKKRILPNPKDHYTLSFGYSDDNNYHMMIKRPSSHFEWSIDFPKDILDVFIRETRINFILNGT